jgi:hypothetical protein
MFFLLTILIACRTPMSPTVNAPLQDPTKQLSALLERVVTPDGYVDYDALEADRSDLDAYVAWLAVPRPSTKLTHLRYAYWLNTYNALTLYQVLERGRPDSIMDVDGWLPKSGSGFFLETAFKVEHDWVSLWEIEHERIRQRQLDVRAHAAMNCASRSCPPMRNEAYENAKLNRQLRDQMITWINDEERGVRIEDGVVVFSPIFEWFAKDFDFWTAHQNICEVAATYAKSPLREELQYHAETGCPHRFFEYDWRLNDAGKLD